MKTRSDRFWDKVSIKEKGCWEWLGAHSHSVYGGFWDGSNQVAAHRYAYELLVGAIPPDKEIDHLCKNPNCVNPEHLEPVTHTVNVRRGKNGTNHFNSLKTHCPHGHPYNKRNTFIYRQARGGLGRMCRACSDIRRLKNKTKKTGGTKPPYISIRLPFDSP